MIELFKKLLEKWTCLHKWKLHQQISFYDRTDSNGEGIGLPSSVRQTLICNKCGKIVRINL